MNPVQNILAGGDENLRIEVIDNDDSIEGTYGDLTIKWPGQSEYSLPIELENGIAVIPLFSSQSIDSGDLVIQVAVTGANGASNSSQLQAPILLSPPEILSIDLCQNGNTIDELMFGQTADAVVRIRSSRPILETTASLEQLGWIVTAPIQSPTECGNDVAGQTDSFYFRIQLDSSFVPGEGSLQLRVVDIDEIMSISNLDFEFMHSPPEIEVTHSSNISHEGLLEIMVEMEDADGIDATCQLNLISGNTSVFSTTNSEVLDLDGTGIWSASWLLPTSLEGNISAIVECEDWSGNQVNYTGLIIVEGVEECSTDCDIVQDEVKESSESMSLPLMIFGIILVVVIISSTLYFRNRGDDEVVETWETEDETPQKDERIPEGWTLQEFLDWLDGPMPEEWEEEQWELYRTSLEDLR